ncbi:ABC transporter ATP-binding protein [Conexibacter sp. CPCC 206217]|uniref:ABC transporter ATP-binding protein n=1 Tax=Conexibacter sp. CPCC 206217 TaxID=3064574 RepID=UPI00271F1186|nr:ABC transporter ATP-binding protein [Conexibacter sp. CPCC 206217]MDO8212670.1 ABC transporter ATP-binding protein [Conexibacter sp. CPCC 206217]
MEPLLQIRDLSVEFTGARGVDRAVDGVSLAIGRGERVGLVGESGSGKSVIARAILGLTRPPGRVTGGEIVFDGQNLLHQSEADLTALRGSRIALIPQDASLALNPVLTIRQHMTEVLERHTDLNAGAIREKSLATLRRVGLADPDRVLGAYGGELSGGMKQRVGIALALLCDPELLIADDPTSAVDVTIQAQILSEFRDLTTRLGVSVLFITHDLRVVANVCSRAVVLYAGQVAEAAPPQELLRRGQHPYTSALVACLPSVEQRKSPLPVVAGAPPDTVEAGDGCRFHPRCPNALERCTHEFPPLERAGHDLACWNPVAA